MDPVLEVLAAIAIVALVIGRQMRGQPLSGRQLLVLPLVLIGVGIHSLATAHHHCGPADVVCLAATAALAAGIGAGQGAALRLEPRDGVLWGRLPVTALWLWAALVAVRLSMLGVAQAAHAHLAASSSTILLMLGINRLGQAAVVIPRSWATGIPFAPDQGGRTRLAGGARRAPGRW